MSKPGQINAVESILLRIHLEHCIEPMQAAGIEKVVKLRKLSEEEITKIVGSASDASKIVEALERRGGQSGNTNEEREPPGAVGSTNNNNNNYNNMMDGDGSFGGQKGHHTVRYGNDYDNGSGYDDMRGTRGMGRNKNRRDNGINNMDGGRGRGGRGAHFARGPVGEGDRAYKQIPRDYEEEVEIPTDNVRWLMAASCTKLLKIHRNHNTSNVKFVSTEVAQSATMMLTVYGPTKEGVQAAIEEIRQIVGVASKEAQQARYDYNLHEIEQNVKAVTALCAANIRNKGTPNELSEAVLKSVINTFRFTKPSTITHFSCLSQTSDKEKFEVIGKCIKMMEGVQMIIFAEGNRVEEMAKSMRAARSLGVKQVFYIHRKLPKDERLAALEKFKEGDPNEKGVRNRVIITTSDYAKLARKILIPYVNFVVHFSYPKTSEMYLLQARCCCRDWPGISLLIYQSYDMLPYTQLCGDFEFNPYDDDIFEETVKKVKYDTVTEPLTLDDADPPENWRQEMEREKQEKIEKKKEKAAAKNSSN
eukprot:Tbor_TRINITY_DN5683_c1_g1::TRINITY_DN5683_c1_g1_i2::g.8927::m.8927